MVKANELRLGNLVYGFKTIWQIDFTDFRNYDTDTGELPYDPIQLTPEILERCGFQYYAWPDFLQFSHFIKNDFILRETDSGYSFFNTSKCDNSQRQHLVIIRHLHQLQNLYFALTGEELEYKH